MDINDATSRMIAAIAYQMQGSAFDSVCNVYAPHYRQSSASVLKKDLATQAEALKSYPLTDVIAAFEYFITHHNNGRPFILAGHSQGSNVLMYFLSDYMVKHPELQQRMVAAYLIGYDITPTFLAANPHLVFADTSYDTGVIISYNTEAPVIDGPNPVMTPGVGVCINPLTWTRGETNAPASCNLGAYIRMANGTFVRQPGFADAQVNKERGTLFCTTVDPNDYPPSGAFPKGTYHGMDYQFYYFNLRANAVERVKAYLDK